MQEDRISRFYDLNNIKVESEFVLEYLTKVLRLIQEINVAKDQMERAGTFKIIADSVNKVKKAVDDTTEATTKLTDATAKAAQKQLSAFEQLKAQYGDAIRNAQNLAAQFGAQSDQALKAAQAADIYRQRLQQIQDVVKSGGRQTGGFDPNSVPYANNLAQIEEQQQALQKTGTIITDVERQQAELANSATAMGQAQLGASQVITEATEHIKATGTTVEEVSLKYDEYTGALRDNIEAQILNAQALEANRAKQKEIEGSTDAEIAQLARLKQEELDLVAANNQLSLTIKNQTKEWTAAGGSIDEMQAQLALLKQSYERLSTAQQQSPFGQMMLREVQTMDSAVKTAEKSIGNAQRNVGNYASAIQNVGVKLVNFVTRDLLRAAAGFVVFQLLFQGVQYLIDWAAQLIKTSDALNLMSSNLQNLNDVMKDANKQAGEEVDKLKILYEAATDTKLAMHDRLLAVQELKKEFPDYFSKIDDEIILNGKAKKSYDGLKDSILEAARATAAKAKLDALEAQRLDLDFQRKKIENATTNEKNAAHDRVETEVIPGGFGTTTSRMTKAEQLDLIEKRKQAALDVVDAQDKSLQAQENFLKDFAGKANLVKAVIKDDGSGAAKANKDYSDEVYKQQEAIRKVNFDSQQKQLSDKIKYDQDIVNSEKYSFNERLDATQAFYNNSLKMLQDKKAFQLSDVDNQTGEEKRKLQAQLENDKLTVQQRSELQQALTLIDQKATAQKKLIEATYNADVFALDDASEKQITKLITDNTKERDEVRKNFVKAQLQSITDEYTAKAKLLRDQRDAETSDLEKQFENGTIKVQEYEEAKFNIEQKYSLASIQLGIEQQKRLLDNINLDAEEHQKVQDKLDELEKKADDEVTRIKLENIKKLADARNELASKEKEFAQEGITLAKSLVDGVYDKQKNAIQDQIDLLQQKNQADIEGVNNSLLNAQDKAAAVALINARSQAQQTQLAQQQRKIDEDKAKFDKAVQIAQVTENAIQTEFSLSAKAAEAEATAALLAANPLTVAYAPVALASAAAIHTEQLVVGGLAAAQIAAILATPIPKFFKGKNLSSYDRYAGPAWVGDGGVSEAILRSGGGVEITPNVPTLTHIGKDDIILPDAKMLASMATRSSLDHITGYKKVATDNNQEIRKMGKDIVRAINDKQTLNIRTTGTVEKWVHSTNSWRHLRN